MNIKKISGTLGINNASGAVQNLVDSYTSTKNIREYEETKRVESRHRAEVNISEITAKRDVLVKMLENEHELNKDKLNYTYKVIDNALASGDLECLERGLGAMVKVAETSSLVDLVKLSKQLEDKNNIIDI